MCHCTRQRWGWGPGPGCVSVGLGQRGSEQRVDAPGERQPQHWSSSRRLRGAGLSGQHGTAWLQRCEVVSSSHPAGERKKPGLLTSWSAMPSIGVVPSLPLLHIPPSPLLPIFGSLGQRLETYVKNRCMFHQNVYLILFLEHNT